MDQRIIDLFDEYTHKPLKRQDFINRLARLTGSTAAAMTALSMLEVNYAGATTVPEYDSDIITEEIEYKDMKYFLPVFHFLKKHTINVSMFAGVKGLVFNSN